MKIILRGLPIQSDFLIFSILLHRLYSCKEFLNLRIIHGVLGAREVCVLC